MRRTTPHFRNELFEIIPDNQREFNDNKLI